MALRGGENFNAHIPKPVRVAATNLPDLDIELEAKEAAERVATRRAIREGVDCWQQTERDGEPESALANRSRPMMPFFIGAFSSFRAKNGGAFGLLFLILLTGCDAVAPDDQYQLGPDAEIKPGVAQGAVRELTLPPSKVYPGYTHQAWLYIPAQYSGQTPIALMVFQDGGSFVSRDGPWRVPTVLDNLIQRKELPIMAAVFVDPGRSEHDDGLASEQRSVEYDTLSGQYAQFLLMEVLPEVRASIQITDNPQGRGIAGLSSGGICAFTVAWQRPDAFSKVFSAIGSFVDIRGGGAYPELIRQTDVKPLRVFLQDGAQDGLAGQFAGLDWPGGNRAMARALSFKGYDFQLVMGRGTHSPKHGASIFPAAMRWLWRDYTR